MKRLFALLASVAVPSVSLAQAPEPSSPSSTASTPDRASTDSSLRPVAHDVSREVPIVAYAYSAGGVTTNTFGVQLYGLGLAASGQRNVIGGGTTMWGSPVNRLTIIVEAQRSVTRDFSPSAAAIVRLYGDGRDGLTLGGLGRFKIDGFGRGADGDEVESEVELGALLSMHSGGWHLDANAIGGRGLGDEGEMDAESRLRMGRDVASWLRVGIDAQARLRLAGPRILPNGRSWDFAAGPQLFAYRGNFFVSVTAGPTTTGLVSERVGATALLSVGGATL